MHPLDAMECPGCGAQLPNTATGCACGYQFVRSGPPASSSTFQPAPFGGTSPSMSAAGSDGTFIGGVALGFFCGCIGLAIAHFGNTGAQTKQGALVGFLVGAVLGIVARFAAAT